MGNNNSRKLEELPQMRADYKQYYKIRINREIEQIMRDNDISKNGFSIEVVNESKTHLMGRISGPPETQYSGGIFTIDIGQPDEYPLYPPICKFITKIWHPNVSSQTGSCFNVFRDHWSPEAMISHILLTLQSLLSNPDPNDPQDCIVADQYLNERQLFDKTAKYWTYIYSMDEENRKTINRTEFEDFDKMVKNLMAEKNMSFDQSLAALSLNGWDLTEFCGSINTENV
jgi:ubiquitin-conjugating enzyme (huntingtin interacting protein 2)